MSGVIDDAQASVTDLDAPVDYPEPVIGSPSDSSNYGSSSLEFIIPNKPTFQIENADICTQPNIKPSKHTTEADFQATAAARKLNIPSPESVFYDLIYWKNPETSALVFTLMLTFELGILVCSVISVCSNFFLLLLLVSAFTRIYYRAIGNPEANPFNYFQSRDFRLSPAVSNYLAQIITTRVNNLTHTTIDLFLFGNIYSSIRFGVLLYGLTYIGARFNFLTLCIWVTVLAFGAPKLVDIYKAEIGGQTRRLFARCEALLGRIMKRTVDREKSR